METETCNQQENGQRESQNDEEGSRGEYTRGWQTSRKKGKVFFMRLELLEMILVLNKRPKNYVQVFYAHVKLFHTFIVTSFFIIFGILTLCTMPPKSNISSFPISKFTDTKSGWLRTFFQQLQLSGAVLRHVSVVYSWLFPIWRFPLLSLRSPNQLRKIHIHVIQLANCLALVQHGVGVAMSLSVLPFRQLPYTCTYLWTCVMGVARKISSPFEHYVSCEIPSTHSYLCTGLWKAFGNVSHVHDHENLQIGNIELGNLQIENIQIGDLQFNKHLLGYRKSCCR